MGGGGGGGHWRGGSGRGKWQGRGGVGGFRGWGAWCTRHMEGRVWGKEMVIYPCCDSDPASGHPRAQVPPLERVCPPPAWEVSALVVSDGVTHKISMQKFFLATLAFPDGSQFSTYPFSVPPATHKPSTAIPGFSCTARILHMRWMGSRAELRNGNAMTGTQFWPCTLPGRTWPNPRAIALLCADPSQSCETGEICGPLWHNDRGRGREYRGVRTRSAIRLKA